LTHRVAVDYSGAIMAKRSDPPRKRVTVNLRNVDAATRRRLHEYKAKWEMPLGTRGPLHGLVQQVLHEAGVPREFL
jgi:hypothetical protein